MPKTINIILCVISVSLGFSQDNNQWKINMSIADSFMKIGVYYDAMEQYDIAIEQSDIALLHYKKANACLMARDYEQALLHFNKTLELNKRSFPEASYYKAICLKYLGKYKMAENEFSAIKSDYEGPNQAKVKKWANIELKGCLLGLADTLSQNKKVIQIELAPSGINKANSDFGAILNDDQMYFSSFNTNETLQFKDSSNYCKIYKSKRINAKQYAQKKEIAEIKTDQKAHLANGCFSSSNTLFVYSVCKNDKNGIIKCKLFHCQINPFTGEWSKPKELPNYINIPNYNTTQATIGIKEDGSETLYFASDRPGGYGGMDIWFAPLKENGTFGYPKNCGRKINTNRDEMSPHFILDEMKLAFSSNGREGYGGFDIFVAGGSERKFEKPSNISTPINSSYDDIYFFKAEGEGFFTSNRPGGFSEKFPSCCDDIYYFTSSKAHNLISRGKIFSNSNIENKVFNVSLYSVDESNHSEVLINHEIIGATDQYKFYLQPDRTYRIKAYHKNKMEFFTGSNEFNTNNMSKSQLLLHDIEVNNYQFNTYYELKDIRFDHGSAKIKPTFKKQLNELIAFINNNPELIIEISSHTDNTGNQNYNLKLSEQRALSILNYLKKYAYKKDLSNIIAKGYGSSHPKAPNETEEGRYKNRRCEFRIMGQEIK